MSQSSNILNSLVEKTKIGKSSQLISGKIRILFFSLIILEKIIPNKIVAIIVNFLNFKLDKKVYFTDENSDELLNIAFVLFYSKPQIVPLYLILNQFAILIKYGKLDSRISLWLAHSLVLSGELIGAIQIFRKTSFLIKTENVYLNKFISEHLTFYGNYLVVRGSFAKANSCFEKSEKILLEENDKFRLFFNYGMWVQITALTGDIKLYQKILGKIDNSKPETPDLRYGLRILSIGTYLYAKAGNIVLFESFRKASESLYNSSNSYLDRAIFNICLALINLLQGNLEQTKILLSMAKKELGPFSKNGFYKTLIEGLNLFCTDEKINYLTLKSRYGKYKSILRFVSNSSTQNQKIPKSFFPKKIDNFYGWYREIFSRSFEILGELEKCSIEKIESLILEVGAATIESKQIIEEPEFPSKKIDLDREKSKLSFELVHKGVWYRYVLMSDLVPWRQNESFVAFNSLLLTIQSVAWSHWQTKKLAEANLKKATLTLAKQVSHDIRSPLSALNLVIGSLKDIGEEKRILIRTSVNRINDIANQLLETGKQSYTNENKSLTNSSIAASKSEILMSSQLLVPLIENIVSEKRVQYREKQRVEIEFDLSQGYGLFANINEVELKRVLSNLINNSIEAFPEGCGKVNITIQSESDNHSKIERVLIVIKDNGMGIPEHILQKLGEEGVSYGKESTTSGSGLGVFHAKKIINAMGGEISIQSQFLGDQTGTTVTIALKIAEAPKWFVEKLELLPNTEIISLDDDLSIHQIWRGRFESKNITNYQIQHITFTSGSDFKSWFLSNPINVKNIYLVDFELLNQSQTGLDIIEELGIQAQSILVTSRYEETNIRERCNKLGVRLIPKAMSGFVPIEIVNPKLKVDAILIDDDQALIHATWDFFAKSKGLNIKMFSTPEEFFKAADIVDRKTPIYVDVSLGDGINGIEVAKDIHRLGFLEINLATGYDPGVIETPSFIHKVVGKDFPDLVNPI